MAEQSAQASDTCIDGAIEGMTSKPSKLRSRDRANVRTSACPHESAHRKASQSASHGRGCCDPADFLKESMEHAVQHTRKYIEMLTTFPHELVKPVNAAVGTVETAKRRTAAKAGRHSKGAHKAQDYASLAGGPVPAAALLRLRMVSKESLRRAGNRATALQEVRGALAWRWRGRPSRSEGGPPLRHRC
jgi:hypothetical protein